MKKKILITGGCGFIGSSLAVEFAQRGCEVTCFDNLARRGSEFGLQRLREHGCTFVHGDVRNREDLVRLSGEYDVMLECSAEPSVLVGSQGSDSDFMVKNNLFGSVNCFEFCKERGIAVLFFSTSRIYPYDRINLLAFEELETRYELANNYPGASLRGISVDFPLYGYRSLYGATKLCSEYLLQEYSVNYDIPSVINRCGVVAGPWQFGKIDQGVFTYWILAHYFKKTLEYIGFGGKGKQVRDLLHISDLAELVVTQVDQLDSYRGSVFNVGGSRFSNLSLVEATQLCREITGNQIPVTSTRHDRPADVKWFIADISGTEQEFGWTPKRSPQEILTDTFLWVQQNENVLRHLIGG